MAIKVRKPRRITVKEAKRFLDITEEDIATTFIVENFGDIGGTGPKFHPYDEMIVPIGSYGVGKKKNKNSFITTVGLYVFNKIFIEPELFNVFGYIETPITKSYLSGYINEQLSYAVMEDTITLQAMKNFLMKTQKFMLYVAVLSDNHSMEMLTISKAIEGKKRELIELYKDDIEEGDTVVVDAIEKELLSYAGDILKDDPAMDMYRSGAGGSFDNNFKNMYVMKGAIKDPDPTKGYTITTSNYMDGISKEEYAAFANSLSAGPYQRAKKTEIGGHWEKLFLAATQHIVLDPPGSDCKTKRTISIDVTKNNIGLLMYSYVVQGSRLVEITSKNRNSFIGKTINLRYSSLCESKTGICNTCAGNLFNRLGITNVGLATAQLASKLKLASLRGFHNSTVQLVEIDINHAFNPD